jgi:hypothetical protein
MSPRRPVSAQSSKHLPDLEHLEPSVFPPEAQAAVFTPPPRPPTFSAGHLASSVACLAGVVGAEVLAVRAGHALVPEEPQCGPTRAHELEAHQPAIARSLQRGQLREGLRDLAVAMGLVAHPEGTIAPVPPIDREGDVAPVTTLPRDPPLPPAQELPIATGGSVTNVSPTPPPRVPLPSAPIRRGGRPVMTTPHRDLPPPTIRGARRPVGP